jgi:hypothetical protein
VGEAVGAVEGLGVDCGRDVVGVEPGLGVDVAIGAGGAVHAATGATAIIRTLAATRVALVVVRRDTGAPSHSGAGCRAGYQHQYSSATPTADDKPGNRCVRPTPVGSAGLAGPRRWRPASSSAPLPRPVRPLSAECGRHFGGARRMSGALGGYRSHAGRPGARAGSGHGGRMAVAREWSRGGWPGRQWPRRFAVAREWSRGACTWPDGGAGAHSVADGRRRRQGATTSSARKSATSAPTCSSSMRNPSCP